MANLTLRSVKGSPLTNAEMDGNFEYFTGSHAITGSLTVTEGITGSITNAQTASYAVTASYALNGGGTSNTGDITFEGVKIIGAGTGSGDGNNYSTIELVPDNNLYNNDQYIILDPTSPNHIHVRAGGAIDSSSAYLYLGGEKSNVIVRNLDNSFSEKHWVLINSQTGLTQNTWTFDDNGNTLFPTLTTPRGDTSGGDLTTNTLKLGDGNSEAVISTPNGTDGFPSSQRLVINPGQGSGSGEGGDIYLWAGRGGVDGGSGGDVKVRGGYGPVSGSGGYVRIEGGDTDDGNAGFVEIRGGTSNTAAGGTVDIYGGFGNGNTQNGNVSINTYDSTGTWKNWVFDTDGNLNVPGNITGAGNLATTNTNTFSGDQIISGSILISGSIIPDTDGVSTTSSFSLGSPTNAWKDIYVSNGTINFLDGSGNVQGTIGAGTNATVITGSLVTVPSNPLTGFANASTLLNKSYTSADCAFSLANSFTSYTRNPELYTNGSIIVLPWDRKITAYSIVNNSPGVGPFVANGPSPVLSLPPAFNAGYSVGDTISVYNMSESSSLWKATGSIFVVASVQGVTSVNTGSKLITGTFNTAYIISGSWGNYTNISTVTPSTTESIRIRPGQKATFEVVYWGSVTPGPSASVSEFTENGYKTNFTSASPSTTYVTYLFKGIENL
jgi:hypothetical protein